ncbi:hypothetical protein KW799_02620 [Candidatus Parcubacteria bacterium]|nr:hypothetical protein [Candidatus Parcubacteria bacterium]
MKQRVILLCGPGCCPACPEVFDNATAPAEKQVEITDDFGGKVAMSKSQFSVLVKSAKEGKLDNYAQA